MIRFVQSSTLALLCCCSVLALAQDTVSFASLDKALRNGDEKLAIETASALLKNQPDDPRTIMTAADVFLRCNNPDLALPLYDRYIEAVPQAFPSLWQRGIALYFVGKYAEGADQFVKHREVNPHDVENAAWHYLCLAKAESIEAANRSVLPAPNDSRIPMAEVQQMLVNGDIASVTKAMEGVAKDSPEYNSAIFYGNFYLGLYADANGDQETAIDRMSQAAKNAPRHYMGDVARVYAKHLSNRKPD